MTALSRLKKLFQAFVRKGLNHRADSNFADPIQELGQLELLDRLFGRGQCLPTTSRTYIADLICQATLYSLT